MISLKSFSASLCDPWRGHRRKLLAPGINWGRVEEIIQPPGIARDLSAGETIMETYTRPNELLMIFPRKEKGGTGSLTLRACRSLMYKSLRTAKQ